MIVCFSWRGALCGRAAASKRNVQGKYTETKGAGCLWRWVSGVAGVDGAV